VTELAGRAAAMMQGTDIPAAAAKPAPADRPLPPLREDIALLAGPAAREGSPTWTLHDPFTNRYFRIGWLEFEILSRWTIGRPAEIVERVNAETTLRIAVADVDKLGRFLDQSELVRRAEPAATRDLAGRAVARRQALLPWLTHHYLFFRIPLLQPDAALQRMLAWFGWAYTPAFLVTTVLAGLAGLYLVAQQWDVFLASLPWFLSLEGAAVAALSLLLAKALHELGHGLTARRYGCPVPTMGVAMLLMVPMLYTDTSAAWRLTQRRQRLAIGAAGMLAELALAAYALLAWSFLPDGILRSVVLIWATTTWIVTLMINLSPFMRFDGYYLLSDALDVPNLQERAFALGRHWLREFLFDFGEPPPEIWSPRMRRGLIAYALATWLYRLVLFLGIAVLVYHMFFKALGIVLFAVEIWFFVMRPVTNEMKGWPQRFRSHGLSRRAGLTGLVLLAGIVLAVTPWRTTIQAPAVMSSDRASLYLPSPAQLGAVHVSVGEQVAAGRVLAEFRSPELQHRRDQAIRGTQALEQELRLAASGQQDPAKALILERRLVQAKAEVAALQTEIERLTIRAPIAGRVVELSDALSAGVWFKAGEALGIIADQTSTRIDAYVDEAELERLLPRKLAKFIPDDPAGGIREASLLSIESTATRRLTDPQLGSTQGGAIPVRQDKQGDLVPETPVYRVQLEVSQGDAPAMTVRGVVHLEGEPASIAMRFARRVAAVLLRESGF
jgi:putative peptide zinc metalloprotease protein